MKITSVLLLAVCSLFISCSDRNNPRDLDAENQRMDKIIWEAEFQDLDGNTVKVSDFEGKVVLIDFWETWCGPCLQVFPAMDSLQNEYPDDFVVLTVNLINSDDTSDVQEFKDNNNYEFRYLVDVNDVGDEIITLGIPFKVYLDPDGYLIKSELGSAGTEGDYQKAKVIIEEHKKS